MAENEFESKWRRFHPQSTVWVQNVLDHDVVYKVADEYNNQFEYRLPQGKVCELPGGKVAELGVKRIVDELIQNSKNHARMHEQGYRRTVEDKVILRVKEAPKHKPEEVNTGVIDLSIEDAPKEEEKIEKKEEVDPAFKPKPKKPTKKAADKGSDAVKSVAAASVANLPAVGEGVDE